VARYAAREMALSRVDNEMKEKVEEFQAIGARDRDGNSLWPRMLRSYREGGRGGDRDEISYLCIIRLSSQFYDKSSLSPT
jgi:hypothetical protein